MERDELIAKLESFMPIVDKWEKLSSLLANNRQRINGLESDIRNEEPTFKNIIAMAFLSFLCCFAFDGIVLLILKLFSSIKITFSFYLILSIILTVILTIVLVLIAKRDVSIRSNTLFWAQEERERLEKQFANEVTPYLPDICAIIPQKYVYPSIIKQLYSYLKDCRADNLKEAINLYEENCKTNTLNKQLAQIQKTQEEIKQHAEEAESLAAQTLFWTMYNNDNH